MYRRAVLLSSIAAAVFCLFCHQDASAAGIGNGVNLQPSYYNNGCVNFAWPLMEGISTVRIEIEPDKVEQAKGWLREAKAAGKTIIATYHEADDLGSDNANDLMAAAYWWQDNYAALAAEASFTLNLMNEWGSHNQTASTFASAYNNAISAVRQVYSGTIIVDCAGWGQETHVAADASSSIIDGSIMFSVHIYPAAWNSVTGQYVQNSDLDYLASVGGRPCIVGEFGNYSSGKPGKCDWSAVVNHAKSKGWPVLAWAWNGCGTSMNMVTPRWKDDPDATSFSTNSYFTLMCGYLGNCGPGGSYSGTGNSCTSGGGTPPAAPSNLTATAVSSSQINLSWADNSNNENGFAIERKTGSGGTYAEIATVGAGVTSFQNTGLTASTTYYYRVLAFNADGDSAYSNEASATTQSGGGGATTMHVDSISVAIVYVNPVSNKASATVVVKDNLGTTVSGATVTGVFSGGVTGTVSATTDATGTAVLNSASKKGLTSATFCVSGITHASLTYDSGSNVETCDSSP